MDLKLDAVEARALSAMMEKEAASPEYYPLTLNALRAACNQKTSRDPVMSLSEDEVASAVERLRGKGLARDISGAGHRVHKYGHRLGEVWNLDRRELAVLAVLMLRGPQTVGELRGRSERMYSFDELAGVEATLRRLGERTPPLVTELPRRAGEKEHRFAHLLCGEVEPPIPSFGIPASPVVEERIQRVEEELERLRREFDDFRRSFE